MGLGVFVGLTFGTRPVAPEWAISLASLNYPINCRYAFGMLRGVPIAEAREQLAEMAIEQGAKFLFFIDDDTAPPNFSLRKLIHNLENDPESMVSGGIYFTKSFPPMPVVFQNDGEGPHYQWKFGDVFECASIGTGCMVVKTEVFKHLEKPWFKTTDNPNPENMSKETETDDIYFCKKVRKAGFKILADGGVIPLHWDVITGMHFGMPVDSYPAKAYGAKPHELECPQPIRSVL